MLASGMMGYNRSEFSASTIRGDLPLIQRIAVCVSTKHSTVLPLRFPPLPHHCLCFDSGSDSVSAPSPIESATILNLSQYFLLWFATTSGFADTRRSPPSLPSSHTARYGNTTPTPHPRLPFPHRSAPHRYRSHSPNSAGTSATDRPAARPPPSRTACSSSCSGRRRSSRTGSPRRSRSA